MEGLKRAAQKGLERLRGGETPSAKVHEPAETAQPEPALSSPARALEAFVTAAEGGDVEAMYACRSRAYLERNQLTDKERFRATWTPRFRDAVLQHQMSALVGLMDAVRQASAALKPDVSVYDVDIPAEETLPGAIPPGFKGKGAPSVSVKLVKEGAEWKVDRWGDW